MRRLVTALLLAAVLVSVASAQSLREDLVLAVEWEAGGGQLRWVSAETLAPSDARSLNVGGAPANVSALSPDETRAALGGGDGGRLRIVELETLRQIALLRLGGGFVSRGTWQAPDRLHVLLLGGTTEVVTVDPLTERVLERRGLVGSMVSTLPAGRRLVVLFGPRKGIGPARLAVIAPDGSVRSIALEGLTAGVAWNRNGRASPISRQALPGLAVSPDGLRAGIVGLQKLVEVDLGTLERRTRTLSTRGLTRVAKLPLAGWQRQAIWLPDGRFAVVGHDYSIKNNRPSASTTGLRLLDPENSTSRVLDGTATGMRLVGDTLLAFGGSALRGYTVSGKPRFEVLAGTDTGYVQVARGYAYVGSGSSTRFAVVDVGAGRVVGEAETRKPTVVLGP